MKRLLSGISNAYSKLETFFSAHPILLLIVIAVITHPVWFMPSSTLVYNDWRDRDQTAVQDIMHFSRGAWLSHDDLGGQNVQLYTYAPTVIWGLVGSYNIGVKLAYLWPITILSLLAPYLLALKLCKERRVALLSALVYGFSTYIVILSTNHLPITFVVVLAPLVLLALMNLKEHPNLRSAGLLALTYTVGCLYELRVMFLLTIVLVLYSLFNRDVFKTVWIYASAFMIFVLNLFWVLPTVFGGTGQGISDIADRGLFGNGLLTVSSALSNFAWRWTGGLPERSFIAQPIKVYAWIVPVIAVLSLIFVNKYKPKHRKEILFFVSVLLIGALFGKQVGEPFSSLYQWFYDNVPGFNLFREASKYYVLISVGYLGLITYALNYLYSVPRLKKLYLSVSLLLLLPVALVAIPMSTGTLGTLFVNRTKPADYQTFSNVVLKNRNEFYRTLWIPRSPTWGVFNDDHPRVDASNMVGGKWSVFQRVSNGEDYDKTLEFIKSPSAQSILSGATIRYVIVPNEDTNNDDLFIYYGYDRQYFISALDKISWLRRVDLGTTDLAVYENKSYKPYVNAASTLYGLKENNINNDQMFIASVLGDPSPHFITADPRLDVPQTNIEDLTKNITHKDIKPDSLTINKYLPANKQNNLYVSNEPSFSYKITGDALEFDSTQSVNAKTSNTGVVSQDLKKSTTKVFLKKGRFYQLSIGDQLYDVGQGEVQRKIGTVNSPLTLLSSDGVNLLKNGSFESGLWNYGTGDCNSRAKAEQDQTQHTQGRSSLLLTSLQSTTCLRSEWVKVKQGDKYSLDFDALVDNGRRVGYEVAFNDSKKTIIRNNHTGVFKPWRRIDDIFQVPVGATAAQVKLVAYPSGGEGTVTKTNIDNIRLQHQVEEAKLTNSETPKYQIVELSSKSIHIEEKSTSNNSVNIIPNYSFEDGLWHNSVNDCNNYDNKPSISMLQSSESKTDGQRSLELSALRHTACTGPPKLNVDESNDYLFSFDYESPSPNATKAGYLLSFNDTAHTVVKDDLNFQKNDWHTFSSKVHVPYGATSVQLTLYGYPNNDSAKAQVTRYDNLSLVKLPDVSMKYYLVSQQSSKLTKPKNISFSSVNPSKKIISVKGASTGFFLNMSEAYNAKWRLSLENSASNKSINPFTNVVSVKQSRHYVDSQALNGWYVDPADICKASTESCISRGNGTYDIKLVAEYSPQRWFYMGGLISLTAIGLLMICLLVTIKKRRKDEDVSITEST